MLHGIDRRHHEFHQIPKDGAPFSGGTGMEGSVANPRLRGAVEDGEGGGGYGRCGRRRHGGTLARTGRPLYSLDRGNGLSAHLI
jgi:hypothetical protein